ncbi:MAG TPA: hypothetical protein V6C72_16395 [Chroococcales cyanobacterium]
MARRDRQPGINCKSVSAALAVIAVLSSLSEPAFAQPKQNFGASQKKGNPLKVDDLKQAPQLPDLPDFTGHSHFVVGTVQPGPQGPSYIERFLAKEEKSMVIDWYKNTLNMYKWTITGNNATMVAAEKEGSWVVISVADCGASKAPDRTELSISYFQKTR